jgi:integrase
MIYKHWSLAPRRSDPRCSLSLGAEHNRQAASERVRKESHRRNQTGQERFEDGTRICAQAVSRGCEGVPRRTRVAKVLPPDLKRKLFDAAASRPEWLVAHCAAVLAVSTTCRGVEIKNLRWQDVDLFSRVATIRRSKTAAGHRTIPLNGDAMAALARLLERARALGTSEPEHYVFPACEKRIIDPSRPQKSWRTAWRKLVRETARRVGREAAQEALKQQQSIRAAIAAWKRATAPIRGLRFHDLRH